ncbi:MAG: uracil phosphoribosyltransferase [Phycisphaeraceae bacterium]|nr:uracil phosphoribosyltransferase [Phycisphaerales bacterium]MCB1957133.1 uracil phosphoribosyltransferase [Rhodocyclaceae bacterium]MCB9842294.1 uracil phosphoribosyltransferase [Phycisphaeraceae bacterium]
MPPAPSPKTHYPNLVVFDHPLIQHKLTLMRDKTTGFMAFRSLMRQIAALMVFEVTRTFHAERIQVDTPLEQTTGSRINAQITVVPVLRAGLGMADAILEVMPEARVGHLGLARDEKTLKPISYLSKLPKHLNAGPVILVDPMLATGGSAVAALTMLREAGADDLRMIALVASPEGVTTLGEHHPDVKIYAAALDRGLDERGYIRPGLGDAGDRLYGTT